MFENIEMAEKIPELKLGEYENRDSVGKILPRKSKKPLTNIIYFLLNRLDLQFKGVVRKRKVQKSELQESEPK